MKCITDKKYMSWPVKTVHIQVCVLQPKYKYNTVQINVDKKRKKSFIKLTLRSHKSERDTTYKIY